MTPAADTEQTPVDPYRLLAVAALAAGDNAASEADLNKMVSVFRNAAISHYRATHVDQTGAVA